MSDLLRRLFAGHREREPEAAPTEFTSPEAGLRFSFDQDRLSIYLTGGTEPLFATKRTEADMSSRRATAQA